MTNNENTKNKMTVDDLKNEFIKYLSKIDKKALDMNGLKGYADILKTISEIKTGDLFDIYKMIANQFSCTPSPKPVQLVNDNVAVTNIGTDPLHYPEGVR